MMNVKKLLGRLLLVGGGIIGFVGCHDNKEDYDGPALGVIWDFYAVCCKHHGDRCSRK